MLNFINMKALLFDSKYDQLVMMEELLKRIGCKVSPVMREHECIRKLMNGRYDLFLFDHSTPGLDVSGFVDQIEEIDPSMPIVMMVTLPSSFYEDKYGCSGIDFLLFKPFGYDEVLFLLKEAFQYSQQLKKAS